MKINPPQYKYEIKFAAYAERNLENPKPEEKKDDGVIGIIIWNTSEGVVPLADKVTFNYYFSANIPGYTHIIDFFPSLAPKEEYTIYCPYIKQIEGNQNEGIKNFTFLEILITSNINTGEPLLKERLRINPNEIKDINTILISRTLPMDLLPYL